MKLTNNIPQITSSYRRKVLYTTTLTLLNVDRNNHNYIKPTSEYYPIKCVANSYDIKRNMYNHELNVILSKTSYATSPIKGLLLYGKYKSGAQEEMFSNVEKFINQPPYFTISTYHSPQYKTFVKASVYKAMLSLNGNTYANIPLPGKGQIIVYGGVISENKGADFLINNCLSIDKFLEYTSINRNKEILAALMIDKKVYKKTRLDVLISSKFDFDYNYVKFFVSPKLFDRKEGYVSIGNFLKKYIYPILDNAGVEIINESPDKFFDSVLGAGYETTELKKYFIANNKEILKKLPYVGEPYIKNYSHLFASISD